MVRFLAFGVALALAVVGCGGAEGDGTTDAQCSATGDAGAASEAAAVCEAGRVVECPCAMGAVGTQACASNGSRWEACACPDPVTMSPQALCGGVITAEEAGAASPCPKDKPKPFKQCPSLLVTGGKCVADATFYCCADD